MTSPFLIPRAGQSPKPQFMIVNKGLIEVEIKILNEYLIPLSLPEIKYRESSWAIFKPMTLYEWDIQTKITISPTTH